MHPDELPFVMRCSRRISKDSSSRTIVLFVNHPRIRLDRNTNVRLILSSINIIKKDKFSSTFFRIQGKIATQVKILHDKSMLFLFTNTYHYFL